MRTPSGERGTTAITYLLFAPDTSLDDEGAVAQHYAQQTLGGPRAAVVGVTGAAPAREAQFHEIEQALPLIEAASVVLIALIVALAFRSIGAPLVALAAAGIAYTIAMRVLPWLGERANVTVPKEIEPVVVVLLLGLVTDYSIFFLSETRRRLRAGDERLPAARGGGRRGRADRRHRRPDRGRRDGRARRRPPAVLPRLRPGPGRHHAHHPRRVGHARPRAGGAVRAAAVRRAGSCASSPRRRRTATSGERGLGRAASSRCASRDRSPPCGARASSRASTRPPRWRLVLSRVASSRPVALPIALIAIGLLVFAALNVRSTALGLSLVRALPAGDQVRRADDAASRGFAPGIVSPTEVDVLAPGVAGRTAQLARLQALVAPPARRRRGGRPAPSSRPRPRRR